MSLAIDESIDTQEITVDRFINGCVSREKRMLLRVCLELGTPRVARLTALAARGAAGIYQGCRVALSRPRDALIRASDTRRFCLLSFLSFKFPFSSHHITYHTHHTPGSRSITLVPEIENPLSVENSSLRENERKDMLTPPEY